ncbi:hypothetical protein VTK73DRAFT_5698 [Phialemonium thermophilum]|uniref:F-box domain-containing protein n=1 Tax=Phialemonium thermophilum TaxID=223376 RepID=A0ABR3WMI8_9PEZI
MENQLTQQLLALGPDMPLRRANIRNLLSSLTKYEIREAALQLSAVEFRFDIIGNIPTEILLLIAEYVRITDIYTFFIVSRRWKEVWLQPQVVRLLARRFFPGFLECVPYLEKTAAHPQNTEELFHQEICKFQLRFYAKFRSMMEVNCWIPSGFQQDIYFQLDTHLPLDDDVMNLKGTDSRTPPFPEFSDYPLYSDGRVAWVLPRVEVPSSSFIFGCVVDDLRTQVRKVYRVHNRDLPPTLEANNCLAALGDQLVVMAAGRTLFAWHIESNEYRKTTLPQIPRYCATARDVVVVESSRSIIVWKFGRQTSTITIPTEAKTALDIYDRDNSQDRVPFCHPFDEEIFYFVASGPGPSQVRVQQFVRGEYAGTLEPPAQQIRQFCPTDLRPVSRVTRAGAFGNFAIALRTRVGEWGEGQGRRRTDIILLFNVFTHTFSFELCPDLSVYLGKWSSSTGGTEWRLSLGHLGASIVASNTQIGRRKSVEAPVYSAAEGKADEIADSSVFRRCLLHGPSDFQSIIDAAGRSDGRVQQVRHLVRLGRPYVESSYALDLGTVDVNDYTVTNHKFFGKVFEDEDFIVFTFREGYFVWSFSTDLVVRGSASAQGRKIQ